MDNVMELPAPRRRRINRRELAPVVELRPRLEHRQELLDSYTARIREIDAEMHELLEERMAIKAKLRQANAV